MKNVKITGIFVCIMIPQLALGIYQVVLTAKAPGTTYVRVDFVLWAVITDVVGPQLLEIKRNDSPLSTSRDTICVYSPDIGRWKLPT